MFDGLRSSVNLVYLKNYSIKKKEDLIRSSFDGLTHWYSTVTGHNVL